MGSLPHFENKNILFYSLAYYNAGAVAVNPKAVGLAQVFKSDSNMQVKVCMYYFGNWKLHF
jgi:hypothetical protein